MNEVNKTSDEGRQLLIGNLLRIGMYISMGIVMVGAIIYLINHSTEKPNYSAFNFDKVKSTTIQSVFTELLTFNGKSVIQFGLLMLIFTPIARVMLSVISFFLEKDYLYVVIGLIVLAIIMVSLNSGFGH